jgi:cyclopropane fatty-acyl-phospholipid synthase-like methyltransferase
LEKGEERHLIRKKRKRSEEKLDDAKRQEDIRSYYDRKGGYWEVSSHYRTYQDLLVGRLQKYRVRNVVRLASLNGHETVLDLGCALGNISYALAPYCKKVVGVDYSKVAIKEAKRILSTSPFRNIRFVRASADKTGLKSGSFDLIVSADLFEHLYPDVYRKTLDECKRLLKKGGRLVIWTPNPGHFIEFLKRRNIIIRRDISHVDYKRKDSMVQDLQDRNFRILRAEYAPSHIPILSVVESLLLRGIPFFRRRIAIVAEKK